MAGPPALPTPKTSPHPRLACGRLQLVNGTATVNQAGVVAWSFVGYSMSTPSGINATKEYQITAATGSFTITAIAGDGSTDAANGSQLNWMAVLDPTPAAPIVP